LNVRPGRPIRIVLVDDHPAFRRGIRDIISDEDDMEVAGEASDADEALALISRLGPTGFDVVLMDIELPGMDGIAVTRSILAKCPQAAIIMLTVSGLDQDLYDSIDAGAVGFLSKSLVPDAVVRALREFHAGGPLPIPRTSATKLLEHLRHHPGSEEEGEEGEEVIEVGPEAVLTTRESEVMDLLGQGKRDREIADELVVSESTVKKHVRAILRKLGARNRTEAVARLRRMRR
jgi:DNA-binding NarL/FixJ family response regulator